MRQIVMFLALVTVILTGCTTAGAGLGDYEIEWVEFIQVKGVTYYANSEQVAVEPDIIEIGDVYSKVKFNVSDHVHDMSYKIKDGDAAFLKEGTKIYTLKNYAPKTRLAVCINENLRIYDAAVNELALKGEDLHDIRGKVKYIDVVMEDENGNSESFKIDDKSKVDKIVNAIMDASIDFNKQYTEGVWYTMDFRLIDDTWIHKNYSLKGNFIYPGIILADDFKEMFLKALE